MASTYAASASLAADATFRDRVTAAMQQNAVAVGQAALGQSSPSGIDKARALLAQAALASPSAYGAQFAWALASDAAVDSTVSDATIASKVAAVWDLIAGVPI